METKKEQGPVFPAGFEHVEERLNEATHRLEQLDNQINNRPKEKGPTIKYNPKGVFERIIPGQRDRERIALEEQQHELRMDTLAQAEAATRNADGKAGRLVRDAVREKMFPNRYRTLEPKDRFNDRYVLKEIEQSQDYMDAMLQPKQNVVKEKDVTDKAEATGKNNLSISARFSLSLSYTKVTQREIGRDRDKEPDKDRD